MSEQFVGKTIAEKYQIESVMQKNGLGGFYRASHVFMEKPAAIKLLAAEFARDEDTVAQFLTKAKAAANISDPNVLNITDSGMGPDGSVYIVYESADGRPLREALTEKGQLEAAEAVSIARQAAAALGAAHSEGVVHGNLSPDSILIANGEAAPARVKVFDFGLADISDANRPGTTIVDRPAEYMSPEQCSGAVDADDRSDLYSLGVILYEMLAGEVPFSGEKASDVMIKHIEEAPPPLSAFRQDLAPEIEPVVLRALAKDPDMRYRSAVEFAEDLDRIQHGVSAEPATAAAAAANNIWKTAFIVLAGISLLAAALIYATSVKQTNPTTALQPDANGQPVQPINPATGVQEDTLSSMTGMPADMMANSNMAVPPGTMPGGDGYNPWASGTAPPPGGPPVGPGGQVITIDPNNPSQFMPPDGVILVPIPANANTAVKPTPTPKTPAANANVAATPAPKPPVETKPTPTSTPKSTKTPETGGSQETP
jgi:serine/threonine protein kinase